ncbi:MAG: 3-hydroxyacyl-ACP dehydratase FabZ [Leptospirales bacterium]
MSESVIRLNIQEIMEILPHRYPFLLVDRILEVEPGKKITGVKNVSINEPFFVGHFPEFPIMPGVLLIEAMAQVGGILAICSGQDKTGRIPYFMGIDHARFRHPVAPGDTLIITLTTRNVRGSSWKMQGEIHVGEKLVCEAEIMAMIRQAPNNGEMVKTTAL